MISLEIHHGENFVHYSLFHPLLHVLRNGSSCVPTIRKISRQIVMFSHRRATEHNPRLKSFYGCVYFSDAARYILSPPLTSCHSLAVFFERGGIVERNFLFGITNIIEMNSVNIIVFHDFSTKRSQIIGNRRNSGVHHPMLSRLETQPRVSADYRTLAELLCYAQASKRKGNHPRLNAHSALMTLLHGILQSIIARRNSRFARKTTVPRLNGRGINHRATRSCLQKQSVDAHSL